MLSISSAKTLVLRYFFIFFFLLEGIAPLWDSIDNSIKDLPSTLFHRLFASHSPSLNNYRLILPLKVVSLSRNRRLNIVNI